MVDSGSVWMGKPSSGETKVGGILPWEDVEREAEKLLESTRANERGPENCFIPIDYSVIMISAFASPASVVRGPLPIHRDILLRAASLSHR